MFQYLNIFYLLFITTIKLSIVAKVKGSEIDLLKLTLYFLTETNVTYIASYSKL